MVSDWIFLALLVISCNLAADTTRKGELSIRFLAFDNPSGLTYDGNCCNGGRNMSSSCGNLCDYVMRVVVSGLNGWDKHLFMFKQPVFYNRSNVDFTETSHKAPEINVPFTIWPGVALMGVLLYDYDGESTKTLIDWFEIHLVATSLSSNYVTNDVTGSRDSHKTRLYYSWKISCFDSYACHGLMPATGNYSYNFSSTKYRDTKSVFLHSTFKRLNVNRRNFSAIMPISDEKQTTIRTFTSNYYLWRSTFIKLFNNTDYFEFRNKTNSSKSLNNFVNDSSQLFEKLKPKNVRNAFQKQLKLLNWYDKLYTNSYINEKRRWKTSLPQTSLSNTFVQSNVSIKFRSNMTSNATSAVSGTFSPNVSKTRRNSADNLTSNYFVNKVTKTTNFITDNKQFNYSLENETIIKNVSDGIEGYDEKFSFRSSALAYFQKLFGLLNVYKDESGSNATNREENDVLANTNGQTIKSPTLKYLYNESNLNDDVSTTDPGPHSRHQISVDELQSTTPLSNVVVASFPPLKQQTIIGSNDGNNLFTKMSEESNEVFINFNQGSSYESGRVNTSRVSDKFGVQPFLTKNVDKIPRRHTRKYFTLRNEIMRIRKKYSIDLVSYSNYTKNTSLIMSTYTTITLSVSLPVSQMTAKDFFGDYWPAILSSLIGIVFISAAIATSFYCKKRRVFLKRRVSCQHVSFPSTLSSHSTDTSGSRSSSSVSPANTNSTR